MRLLGIQLFKDTEPPSWLTSTTSLGFLIVVIGAVSYAVGQKDAALLVKLVEMIVPAFLMNKGVQMGQNGKKEEPHEPPAPVGPPTP